MNRNYRKRSEETLILAIACGSTLESAAAKCGLSLRTVRRRLQEEPFKKKLSDLHREIVQRGACMLTAASAEAIKTLMQLMQNENHVHVRLSAARGVLELGYKYREIAEIHEKITLLEKNVQQLQTDPKAT